MNSPSVERESTPPPSFQKLAEQVKTAGGWIHCENTALQLAANMNAQEWQAFTAAIAQIGLTQLADVLRKQWCKVGTKTVPTVTAAVQQITRTHNLRLMLGAAIDQAQEYDDALKAQLVAELERVPLTQHVAKELRVRFSKTLEPKH